VLPRGTLVAVSVLVVLFGGPRDGWEFRVPDDDAVATSGLVDLPEFDEPPPDDLISGLAAGSSFTLRYRWDGTVSADGARRFRLDS
jgi:hypothetical protein